MGYKGDKGNSGEDAVYEFRYDSCSTAPKNRIRSSASKIARAIFSPRRRPDAFYLEVAKHYHGGSLMAYHSALVEQISATEDGPSKDRLKTDAVRVNELRHRQAERDREQAGLDSAASLSLT